ncbi:MAG: HAD family hydrolase [Candidatus Altiarchaeota archaeon]|nr:HAD family hydrolase [Candidatus Altiarchaeota archaeon]
MFGLIVFDLDGVLWISNEAHVEVCLRALERAGVHRDVDAKAITRFFGLPYREVLREVMGVDYSPEKLDIAYREQQRLLYSDSFFERVSRIEGLEDLLSKFRDAGIRLAVASGNERAFLDKALRFLRLSGFFDLVLSADDVSRSKPDPEMLCKAMDFFSVKPLDTLFVGDAFNDVLAAKNAGVCSAVVLTGALGLDEAMSLDVDFILDSVLDLGSVLP